MLGKVMSKSFSQRDKPWGSATSLVKMLWEGGEG
jgi:hypothetical protein